MSRASLHRPALIALLALSAAPALAQEPLPSPDDAPAPAPAFDEPPSVADDAPVAPAETDAPPPTPPYEEAQPAPQPPPAPERRYEGQVDSRQAPAYSGDPEYDEEGDDYSDGDSDDGEGFTMPPFSIRIDPLNWLLDGKLGFELEVGVLDFMTVELVPVFVTNDEPPGLYSGLPDGVARKSGGIGALAGTSIGAGFWLNGTPLRGYVLRAVLTNYSYEYETSNSAGVFDRVPVVERRFMGYLGSHNRIGIFTIAGAIGLGYELHQQQRCVDGGVQVSDCPDEDALEILVPTGANTAAIENINGWAHPIYLDVRFSLGLAFD